MPLGIPCERPLERPAEVPVEVPSRRAPAEHPLSTQRYFPSSGAPIRLCGRLGGRGAVVIATDMDAGIVSRHLCGHDRRWRISKAFLGRLRGVSRESLWLPLTNSCKFLSSAVWAAKALWSLPRTWAPESCPDISAGTTAAGESLRHLWGGSLEFLVIS